MRITEIAQRLTADKRKVSKAAVIIKLLTKKEYSVWIKRLSKCGSPEEQELTTAEYFKEIGKYDKLKQQVRII